MIVDRPITVSYYNPEAVKASTEGGENQPQVTSVKTESEIENKPYLPPASERVGFVFVVVIPLFHDLLLFHHNSRILLLSPPS